MAQFISPFVGMVPERRLNRNEMVRAARMAQGAELEAVHFYTAIADASDNPVVSKMFNDIADEEKVHQGEFLRIVEYLTGDEGVFILQGANEADRKTEGIRNEGNTSPKFNPLDPLGIMQLAQRDMKRLAAAVRS